MRGSFDKYNYHDSLQTYLMEAVRRETLGTRLSRIRPVKSCISRTATFPHVQASSCCRSCLSLFRPRLHASGQIFAQTKFCTVPPCVYMGPAKLDGFLRVQVWDLKKARTKLVHLAVQKSVQFRRSHVNARWNHASQLSVQKFGPV